MSELFDDLANVDPTKPAAKGRVRLREPSR
ncbi:hypothetical protein M2323_001896, partial [Rhodoblastus acidophilus]|nr:hypothetical protein [Rhodoblastus acidophilus]MCW2283672.1 hypothetical protein [Rhodoblastus acidophilus]MCW2332182.1 hypothetical protein [Rhodoblastus acidophilus]MCW2332979.1 hypothetical protein [Rhodoblastus acidophilus]